VIPTYLIYHVVTPVPFVLAMKQIAFRHDQGAADGRRAGLDQPLN